MAEPLSDVVIAQVVDSPKGQKCKLTTCPLQTLLPGTRDTEINFHSAENPELSKVGCFKPCGRLLYSFSIYVDPFLPISFPSLAPFHHKVWGCEEHPITLLVVLELFCPDQVLLADWSVNISYSLFLVVY